MLSLGFIFLVVSLVVMFAAYSVASYPVLKYLGVTNSLAKRSFFFGSIVFTIQTACSTIFDIAGIPSLGFFFGLAASFYYVNSVLNVSITQNVLIIFFLPFAASLVAAPILMIFFKVL